MDPIDILNEYKTDIQQLFRSELRILILLALYGSDKSLKELEIITGRAPTSIITKTKLWIDYGFVQKSNNGYILTTAGHITTLHLISLIKLINVHTEGNYLEKRHNITHIEDDTSDLIRFYLYNKEITNSILRSNILLNILLSLEDGKKTQDSLKDIIDCTSPVLTSKIRQLETYSLIKKDLNCFSLTSNGVEIKEEIKKFIVTVAAMIKHKIYWKMHIIDELPDFALYSLGNFICTKEVHDTPEEPFKNYENWMMIINECEYLHSVSNYIIPGVAEAIAKKVYASVPMEIIISGQVAQKILEDPYIEHMKDLGKYPHMQIYVIDIPRSVSFTITDKCFTIKFSMKNPDYFDTSSGLVSRSEEAREWGERLFQHYKSDAVPFPEYYKQQLNE